MSNFSSVIALLTRAARIWEAGIMKFLYKAVFISDLHLSSNSPQIQQRFESLVNWACQNTKAVYILGDFFHVWAGDDLMNPWSHSIAKILARLADFKVKLYWMPGNRDFLVGKTFLNEAHANYLPDGTSISLDHHRILLTHGDQYCSNDKGHQWLRRFTRNKVFINIFQLLPKILRNRLVQRVRNYSANKKERPQELFLINKALVEADLKKNKANIMVHGHIHKVQEVTHNNSVRYVLSDWDDMPAILCYDKTKGFRFNLLGDLICH